MIVVPQRIRTLISFLPPYDPVAVIQRCVHWIEENSVCEICGKRSKGDRLHYHHVKGEELLYEISRSPSKALHSIYAAVPEILKTTLLDRSCHALIGKNPYFYERYQKHLLAVKGQQLLLLEDSPFLMSKPYENEEERFAKYFGINDDALFIDILKGK